MDSREYHEELQAKKVKTGRIFLVLSIAWTERYKMSYLAHPKHGRLVSLDQAQFVTILRITNQN